MRNTCSQMEDEIIEGYDGDDDLHAMFLSLSLYFLTSDESMDQDLYIQPN